MLLPPILLLNLKVTFHLLFVVFLASAYWYYRQRIVPYLKFPVYFLLMDFKLLFVFLTGKGTGGATPTNYAFRRVFQRLTQCATEGMCVFWTTEPNVVLFNEEAVKLICNDPTVIDKPSIYDLVKLFIKSGIFVSGGNEYKKQKKMISRAFYPIMIKGTVPVMNESSKIMVHRLNELGGIPTRELEHILQDCTNRIFMESSVGIIEDQMESRWKIVRAMILKGTEYIGYSVFCPWLWWDFVRRMSPYSREVLKMRQEGFPILREMLDDLKKTVCSRKIAKNCSTIESEDFLKSRKTFGEVLIEQHLQDPSFSMEDAQDQLLQLIVAGFDTASGTMYFCLLMLGLHPDIHEKACDEVMSLTDGDIQYDDLCKLTYLECVLKETLRLFPATPIFGRYLNKDVHFGKYKIPKNTSVLINSFLLHRNPETFPDPEVFDPSRFMKESSNIKPWKYIPFAEGARYCLGKNYAMVEMKIMLAHILRNFKVICLDRREDIQLSWELTLKCSKPLRMRLIPR